MSTTSWTDVTAALDRFRDAGRTATFWLRDDDAVLPTPELDRLLDLTAEDGIPVALAVIPEPSGTALAARLRGLVKASVVVHGWRHANHASAPAKKQELGADRPAAIVLGELSAGFAKLADLYGDRFQPVLVPPWNRIEPALLPGLPGLGFRALSVYGPEKPAALPMINTHVDVMDWGTRGCRDWDDLRRDIVRRLATSLETGGTLGLLTHHLVHDAAVWAFLRALFDATRAHPACRWSTLAECLAETTGQNP